MTYSYFVTADTDEFLTDDGEEQATLMTQKVVSSQPLTDEEAYENACASGDWKLYYGEGTFEKVGTYEVTAC